MKQIDLDLQLHNSVAYHQQKYWEPAFTMRVPLARVPIFPMQNDLSVDNALSAMVPTDSRVVPQMPKLGR